MYETKIEIKERNRFVGSMVRGLAAQIAGTDIARGQTTDLLEKQGYYVFKFNKQAHADDFRALSMKYLGDYIEIE